MYSLRFVDSGVQQLRSCKDEVLCLCIEVHHASLTVSLLSAKDTDSEEVTLQVSRVTARQWGMVDSS